MNMLLVHGGHMTRTAACVCKMSGVLTMRYSHWRLRQGERYTEEVCCMQAGDKLYTASMKPIMTFLEQTGPGCHDTTAAACSYGLYVLQIGEVTHHLLASVLYSTAV